MIAYSSLHILELSSLKLFLF